jgi:hypothetical protein
VELANYSFPSCGAVADAVEVQGVERQASGAEALIVARDAVFI